MKTNTKPCPLSEQLFVLELQGSLDATCASQLAEAFDRLIAAGQINVVVELSGVTFISSPAFGELLGCKKRLLEENGFIILVGVSTDLKTKLNLLGADKIFLFAPDMRSAVIKFNWERKRNLLPVIVSFPPDLKFVPPVRSLISRVVAQKGYNPRDTFRVETIVDEVCSNAIEYGDTRNDPEIKLECVVDREKVDIAITNKCSPSNQDNLRQLVERISSGTISPDAEGSRGRGIALVKMLCQKLEINVSETGTQVHITKLKEG